MKISTDYSIMSSAYILWKLYSYLSLNQLDNEHNNPTWGEDASTLWGQNWHLSAVEFINSISQTAIPQLDQLSSAVSSQTMATVVPSGGYEMTAGQEMAVVSGYEANSAPSPYYDSDDAGTENYLKIALCLASFALIIWDKHQQGNKDKIFKVRVNNTPLPITNITTR